MVGARPSDLTSFLIAPCGMNCALCLGFQRSRNPCPGCRGAEERQPGYCHRCSISHCETVRDGVSHLCHECDRMPCRRLKQLDARYRKKYGMSMLDNLQEIKEEGMDTFLSRQGERYTCPSCHALLCVHRPQCLSCGHVRERAEGDAPPHEGR